MMEKQNARILSHMQTKGGITSLEAYNLYGVTRLAARIAELKQTHSIAVERVTVQNRYGDKCRVNRYSLLGDNDA